jgi:ribonuclease III
MSSNLSQLPQFIHPTLLECALTHRSYLNEHPEVTEHNERLEFLGDAVLNFLSGEFLYKRYPDQPEGGLTPLRSALVDEAQFTQFAVRLNLGAQLRLSRGAELEGGRKNPNLISSAFEALIGAYFLDTDSDIEAVRHYVWPFFEAVADSLVISAPTVNYKSRFQEWALANVGEVPKYITVKQSGPDHAREFIVEVRLQDQCYGSGQGRSKQNAEKEAARNALVMLQTV